MARRAIGGQKHLDRPGDPARAGFRRNLRAEAAFKIAHSLAHRDELLGGKFGIVDGQFAGGTRMVGGIRGGMRFVDNGNNPSTDTWLNRNQCQASYVRPAKLEDDLEEALGPNTGATEATVRDGQGGPELLPPAAQAQPKPAATPRPAKPMPRFKPAN
jgi:hypothetical protein